MLKKIIFWGIFCTFAVSCGHESKGSPLTYLNRKKYKIAFNLAKSQSGKAESKYVLGLIYYYGLGRKKDYKKACLYFESARREKYLNAYLPLLRLYKKKQCGNKTKDEIFALCKEAAEFGIPEAEYKMGQFYETGFLGERDISKALKWYEKSANKGFLGAQLWMGNAYVSGNEALKKDYEKAIFWYKRTMRNKENVVSYWGLGYSYFLSKNYNMAIKYLAKPAYYGSSQAQFFLGMAYFSQGRKRDAYKWLLIAKKSGFSAATMMLNSLEPVMTKKDKLKINKTIEKLLPEIAENKVKFKLCNLPR